MLRTVTKKQTVKYTEGIVVMRVVKRPGVYPIIGIQYVSVPESPIREI